MVAWGLASWKNYRITLSETWENTFFQERSFGLPLENLKTVDEGGEYSLISKINTWLERSCILSKTSLQLSFLID